MVLYSYVLRKSIVLIELKRIAMLNDMIEITPYLSLFNTQYMLVVNVVPNSFRFSPLYHPIYR